MDGDQAGRHEFRGIAVYASEIGLDRSSSRVLGVPLASWGGRRPSLAGYVTMTGPRTGRSPSLSAGRGPQHPEEPEAYTATVMGRSVWVLVSLVALAGLGPLAHASPPDPTYQWVWVPAVPAPPP